MARKLSLMQSVQVWLVGVSVGALSIVASVGNGMTAAATPQVAALPVPVSLVAGVVEDCTGNFFGLRPWFSYMEGSLSSGSAAEKAKGYQKCDIKCFNFFPRSTPNECNQQKSDIPGILLAIIDDLLRIAGLVAVAYVLIGAFQYVASRGSGERTAQAQNTITNALVGLVVAMIAVGFLSFLGGRL